MATTATGRWSDGHKAKAQPVKDAAANAHNVKAAKAGVVSDGIRVR